MIRGRLAGLARGWGNGEGPRAVLACPPGELHDLPLLIFGIILNRRGWRVDYFGANTPVVELIDGARRSPPDLIVVAATAPERLTAIRADLAHLAAVAPLALAGAGASPDIADAVGAELLTGDPVTAASSNSTDGGSEHAVGHGATVVPWSTAVKSSATMSLHARCARAGLHPSRSHQRRRSRPGAPGRIRTCDARFRKPTLYPLSYEGAARIYLRVCTVGRLSSRRSTHGMADVTTLKISTATLRPLRALGAEGDRGVLFAGLEAYDWQQRSGGC